MTYKYPVIEVLNTISLITSLVEPILVPVNTVPSSSIKKAFIVCPAFLLCSPASWQKKRGNLFFAIITADVSPLPKL